jgi:hypothetical protein
MEEKNDLAERIKLLNKKFDDSLVDKSKGTVRVYTRCVFERIIDIDTKNEKYDADVIIESSWYNDEILKTLLSPNFNPGYRMILKLYILLQNNRFCFII